MLVRVFGCPCLVVPIASVTDASVHYILGGNITVQDLENYNAKITFPLVTAMKVENYMFELFSPPPPASGAVFFLMLNILKGSRVSLLQMFRVCNGRSLT